MMAKESTATGATARAASSLEALGDAARAAKRGGPPVHLWNPPFCGDIDIRIGHDGTWFHAGTPINRPALVRLFASILRHDPDGVMLVTPAEKLRITVEDAAFMAVEMRVEAPEGDPVLSFRTNVDEWVRADDAHPLAFRDGAAGGVKPYLGVRPGLEALVTRAVGYELLERGELRGDTYGVRSAGTFFPIATADALGSLA